MSAIPAIPAELRTRARRLGAATEAYADERARQAQAEATNDMAYDFPQSRAMTLAIGRAAAREAFAAAVAEMETRKAAD